jgi:hypothetical protein
MLYLWKLIVGHRTWKSYPFSLTFVFDGSGCGSFGYWLDDRGVEVRFPTGATHFSLLFNVQIGSEARLVSIRRDGYQGLFPRR